MYYNIYNIYYIYTQTYKHVNIYTSYVSIYKLEIKIMYKHTTYIYTMLHKLIPFNTSYSITCFFKLNNTLQISFHRSVCVFIYTSGFFYL